MHFKMLEHPVYVLATSIIEQQYSITIEAKLYVN